jgi:PKD repeat protein
MRRIAFALLLGCIPFAQAHGDSCGTMNSNNVFISFADASATCSNATTTGCTAGDPITFAASAFGYTFNCAAHTFAWDFGDGTNATSPTATHVYSAIGLFTVKLTISSPVETLTLSQLLPVGPTGEPPLLIVRFNTRRVSGFDFVFTPDPAVAMFANEAEWDFGDGAVISAQPSHVIFHSYANPGTYRVTLRVNRTLTYSSDVAAVTRQRAARH